MNTTVVRSLLMVTISVASVVLAKKAPSAQAKAGTVTEYPLGADLEPWGIAPGPDGNVWFAEWATGGAIGRITPQGAASSFSALAPSDAPYEVAPGPDGNVWFTTGGHFA